MKNCHIFFTLQFRFHLRTDPKGPVCYIMMTFNKYKKIGNARNLRAEDVAKKMLNDAGMVFFVVGDTEYKGTEGV